MSKFCLELNDLERFRGQNRSFCLAIDFDFLLSANGYWLSAAFKRRRRDQ